MEPIWNLKGHYELQTALQAHMQGDPHATDWLVEQMLQHRSQLLSYSARMNIDSDTAEDLIQETILTALTPYQIRALTMWGTEANLYLHLCKILRGKISTYLRSACRCHAKLEELSMNKQQENSALHHDPITQVEENEFRRKFWAAINQRLNPVEKQILVLRYVKELTWNDIAAILNISSAALRQRDMRMRQKLRDWQPLAQLCRDYGFLLSSADNHAKEERP